MPTPTTYTPAKEFLGVAPETTAGTAVPMTATIPFTKVDFEDQIKWLDDPSLRGSMAGLYGRYPGVREVDFSIEGPAYVDTFPHLLQSMLGDRTTTGAADPYVHAFALNNSFSGQPITHTLTWFTGITASVGARIYPGACLSELSIEFDIEGGGGGKGGGGGGGKGGGGGGGGKGGGKGGGGGKGLVQYKSKGQAWGSSVAAATPVAAPSSVPPFAAWRALLGIGGPASGGTLVANVSTASFVLKRKLDVIYTFSNQQQPYVIQRGALTFEGKCTFIAVDESPLLTMLAGTVQPLQLVLDNGVVGAGKRAIQVDMQQCIYEKVKTEDGKEATMFMVDFDGIANSTNAGATGGLSPGKITVTNGTAGTVYGS